MFLYKITNKINGKIYIGQTIQKNPNRRWMRHLSNARNNNKNKYPIHLAINKYGEENFDFIVIAECKTFDDLDWLEVCLIKQYDCLCPNGYNLLGGGGQYHIMSEITREKLSKINIGRSPSEETKKKLSEANKGKKLSDEHKRKISESLKGKICRKSQITEEERKQMSINFSGERNPNFGKTFSEEYRKKLSEAQKGKHFRKHTEETKLKLSKLRMGKNNPAFGKPANNRRFSIEKELEIYNKFINENRSKIELTKEYNVNRNLIYRIITRIEKLLASQ